MSDYLIDLAQWPFWAAVAVAIVLLAPRTRGQHRSWTFALINLGFIAILGGWRFGAIALAGAFVAWELAHLVRRSPGRGIWVVLAMGLALAFFLLHKLPNWSIDLRIGQINPFLRLVGYSYIALRLLELYRAMYEQRYEAPSLLATINYLVPFHMLAAGPIQSYDEFVEQPGHPRPLDPAVVLKGAERIAFGVFKKFVIAFIIQKLFLTNFTVRGAYWIVEAQMFFIWLYLDFSAYSDIAVGIGNLIGVSTPENFIRPYFSRNMVVFWERWHISLSLWIRRNLFFPVQIALIRRTDGKKTLLCASAGFAVSFLLCGLWHGIALNFLAWGAMHASGLIVVNLYRSFLQARLGSKGMKVYLANPYFKLAGMALTFEWVALSHVLFFYHF